MHVRKLSRQRGRQNQRWDSSGGAFVRNTACLWIVFAGRNEHRRQQTFFVTYYYDTTRDHRHHSRLRSYVLVLSYR